MKRIMTKLDQLEHCRFVQSRHPDISEECLQGTIDLATLNSNRFHNPQTGHLEFFPDTPLWIAEMAFRRGWYNMETEIVLRDRYADKY